MALGVFRPMVDRLDRWLVSTSWNIPSQWNAIADAAIRTDVVGDSIAGRPAPWRHASVDANASPPIAVITVSDLRIARVAFVTDRYQNVGGFERAADAPSLVTDEARGYKPLSHIWPIVVQNGRLHTLIGFTHLVSEEPNAGMFAYVAVGPDGNELLFVCELSWGPGPTWGMLARLDLNHDGFEDFAVYPLGRRDAVPLAEFVWDAGDQRYIAAAAPAARPLVSWWSTTPSDRVRIRRDMNIDDAVHQIVPRLIQAP